MRPHVEIMEVSDLEGLAGQLDFHGTVEAGPLGVELLNGTEGTGLTYPFHVHDLIDLADEIAHGDG